ncbi:unnamed protein product, partial [Protopolystoma xenopodis]
TALCNRLISLTRWIGNTVTFKDSSGSLLHLDDVHNLALLGRLLSSTIPSLLRATVSSEWSSGSAFPIGSSKPLAGPLAGFQTLVNLTPCLSHIDSATITASGTGIGAICELTSERSQRLSMRRLALWVGLIRGLASAGPSCCPFRNDTPASIAGSSAFDEGEKSFGETTTWLWVCILVRVRHYLEILDYDQNEKKGNRENVNDTKLSDESDFIVQLVDPDTSNTEEKELQNIVQRKQLIDMLNQFPVSLQITAWCQCLTFILFHASRLELVKPLRDISARSPPNSASKAKRIRLEKV